MQTYLLLSCKEIVESVNTSGKSGAVFGILLILFDFLVLTSQVQAGAVASWFPCYIGGDLICGKF